jgi:Fe-S-cluster containining protein
MASKNGMGEKDNKPKKSLKEKLHNIYYDTINLDTTCSGRCECCKVACPQMYYSEFIQLLHDVWEKADRSQKINMICKSIEYFFKYEFEKFGMETLIKPCMLLNEYGKCICYENRPLNCRLYGLWPKDIYKRRVDRFAKAYKGLVKRKNLPLNKQCPYVKRVDDGKKITEEIIEILSAKLDNLDAQVGNFSGAQIEQHENYRTFHDWLLLKVFGEQWLSMLTSFLLAADKETIEDQAKQLVVAARNKFAKDLPEI